MVWRYGEKVGLPLPPNLGLICLTGSEKRGSTDDGRADDGRTDGRRTDDGRPRHDSSSDVQ